MKHIHVLPTDKPSRLFKSFGKLNIGDYITKRENLQVTNQHIYITSDEEIKEVDWVITPTNDIIQWTKVFRPDGKKIIITTDQDLIAEGIQPIDDTFLQWFVNNPSCEKVEVQKRYSEFIIDPFVEYKIIIPQKEPKGVIDIPKITEECGFPKEIWKPQEEPKQYPSIHCDEYCYYHCTQGGSQPPDCEQKESKKETIEEAAKECLVNSDLPVKGDFGEGYITGSVFGAKWQQEKDKINYNKEDLREAFKQGHSSARKGSYNQITEQEDFDKWFEKFKNK